MANRKNQLVPVRPEPQPVTYHKVTIPVPSKPRNDWERAGLICLGAGALLLLIGAVAEA